MFRTKKTLIAASLASFIALPVMQGTAFSKVGSERSSAGRNAKTAGGTKTVKLSLIRTGSGSDRSATEINEALSSKFVIARNSGGGGYIQQSRTLVDLVANGYKIENGLSPKLKRQADAIAIRPWKEGQPHVLTARLARTIADRLEARKNQMIDRANRLFDEGKLSARDMSEASALFAYWDETIYDLKIASMTLTKHQVAVLVDE